MTNGIIRIEERNGQHAVSARELHSFLEVKTRFNDWFNNRCSKYGFIDGGDYTKILVQCIRGQNEYDYALTIDCAKELSMVENNDKGRQARRYFIEAEKAFRQVVSQRPAIPQTYSEALRLAAAQAEQLEHQQKLIEEQKPRVLFSQAVETSKESVLIGELAKIICQNGISIGEKRLFQWMRDNHFLCSSGERYNQPTQKSVEQGLFEMRKVTIQLGDHTKVRTTTKVTGKGQIYFVNKFLYTNQNHKA